MRKGIVAAALLLAGCGGGGGGGGDDGVVQLPPNTAPVLTTGSTHAVNENVAAVTTLAATDADNDPLTFSLAGGADADLFAVSGTQLAFRAAPNFDLPGDSDGDNVYLVTIAVSDGKTSVSKALQITVSNSAEGVSLRLLGSFAEKWVGAARLKDGSVRLAAERAVYRFDPASNAVQPLFRWAIDAPIGGRFVSIGEDRSGLIEPHMLLSARLSDGRIAVFSRWYRDEMPFGNFGTGFYSLAFDPSAPDVGGHLGVCASGRACIALGSLGRPAAASSPHYGAVVEFVPNPDPYAGASVGPFWLEPIVSATGLRLPTGVATGPDPTASPYQLILDQGTTRFDEINRHWAGTPRDFGWPLREGTDAIAAGGSDTLAGPEVQFARGAGLRQSQGLTAVAFYRGANPSLVGKTLIADQAGRIFAVDNGNLSNGFTEGASVIENRTLDFRPDSGAIDGIVAILSLGNRTLLLDRDGDIFLLEG